MKCFDQLIKLYITASLAATVGSKSKTNQTYCLNCSTEDAISTILHTIFTHLENKDIYA